jgi:hypothetical protein
MSPSRIVSLAAAVVVLGACASNRVAFRPLLIDCERSQGQRASLRVRVLDEDGGVMPGVPIVLVAADAERGTFLSARAPQPTKRAWES